MPRARDARLALGGAAAAGAGAAAAAGREALGPDASGPPWWLPPCTAKLSSAACGWRKQHANIWAVVGLALTAVEEEGRLDAAAGTD